LLRRCAPDPFLQPRQSKAKTKVGAKGKGCKYQKILDHPSCPPAQPRAVSDHQLNLHRHGSRAFAAKLSRFGQQHDVCPSVAQAHRTALGLGQRKTKEGFAAGTVRAGIRKYIANRPNISSFRPLRFPWCLHAEPALFSSPLGCPFAPFNVSQSKKKGNTLVDFVDFRRFRRFRRIRRTFSRPNDGAILPPFEPSPAQRCNFWARSAQNDTQVPSPTPPLPHA